VQSIKEDGDRHSMNLDNDEARNGIVNQPRGNKSSAIGRRFKLRCGETTAGQAGRMRCAALLT
jgi:hypothetical protein